MGFVLLALLPLKSEMELMLPLGGSNSYGGSNFSQGALILLWYMYKPYVYLKYNIVAYQIHAPWFQLKDQA